MLIDKIQNFKRPLIIGGLLSLVALGFYFFNSSHDQGNSKTNVALKNNSFIQKNNPLKKQLDGQPLNTSPQEPVTLSFQAKQEEIIELGENYPQSKEKLMALILSADPFKNRAVKPHSTDEIEQQKQGALKVLALRMILKNSSSPKDKEQLIDDLQTIIEKAKDPTMSKVAQAVLKSVKRNRPFFRDFGDAIKQL